MLDVDTRRRIDAARDVLVGKVPDPKSQVEQITIALIYKFMDDIDREFCGEREFFAGEFERYCWTNLVRSGLGGHEMLALYHEAIDSMTRNDGLPNLFQNIFKDASLPYRDPETLRLFLHEIDGFEYGDSEAFGDAFEYLLSVLGSQGDAGQFRTPRHIIDFIVRVLDPKKNESVLDPACGTAGFLISAYKHILDANTDGQGASTLTTDERDRLVRNFTGFDISPDMVRLSLVNMYLHGFPDPRILEHDTLTSEDHWDFHADVILANPPFMSPKGGIRPHKRFSVQSKRSEVLFVDYIAEHLTPNGRAGIIVPEGIIFQGQGAHTQLRRMLVNDYLVAVVSLPPGVFQPYSGVKTSILILDRAAARKTDAVAFFKVENDGYALGAQRRPIEADDLPAVQAELAEYLRRARAGESFDGYAPEHGFVVPKSRIAGSEDHNLQAERYREREERPSKWPMVRLGDVCQLNPPKSEIAHLPSQLTVSFLPMADLNEDQISFTVQQQKPLSEVGVGYTYFADNDVLLAKVTPCFENGKAGIARDLVNGVGFGSSEFYVLRSSVEVLPEWIYFCVTYPIFRQSGVNNMTGTGGLQRVPRQFVENYSIPLPPLDVQREIVAEIEGYQRVIDGARAVLDGYRPHVPVDPSWPLVRLGEICLIARGASPRPIQKFVTSSSDGVNWIKIGDAAVGSKYITSTKERITAEGAKKSRWVQPGDFILSNSMSFGRPYIVDIEGCIHDGWLRLEGKSDSIDKDFLYYILSSPLSSVQFQRAATGGVVNNLNINLVRNITVPFPPLNIQQDIASELGQEQALVDTNRELITRMELRIASAVARVWGEE